VGWTPARGCCPGSGPGQQDGMLLRHRVRFMEIAVTGGGRDDDGRTDLPGDRGDVGDRTGDRAGACWPGCVGGDSGRRRADLDAAADETRSDTGNGDVTVLLADLASLDSIRQAASRFVAEHDRLHVLINNAGVNLNHRSVTGDGFETTITSTRLTGDACGSPGPGQVPGRPLCGRRTGSPRSRRGSPVLR
jgi:short chain dehydrogenase